MNCRSMGGQENHSAEANSVKSPLSAVNRLPHEVQRWVALRIRGKWEKYVAQSLVEAGVPVYLPLMTTVTVYPSRRTELIVPLFPGYVFAAEGHFIGGQRVLEATRRRVTQILRPHDFGQLRQELSDIAEFLVDRRLIQERTYGRPGDRVRVVGGPLQGCEGIIRKLQADERTIVIEISFLGSRVGVTLDENMLRPL